MGDTPVVDVYVMGVEVVVDVTAFTSPGFEGVKLLLLLCHVGVVVGEGAQLTYPVPCIRIDGVKALVVLHTHLGSRSKSKGCQASTQA